MPTAISPYVSLAGMFKGASKRQLRRLAQRPACEWCQSRPVQYKRRRCARCISVLAGTLKKTALCLAAQSVSARKGDYGEIQH
jgi:hypothetical protein